MRGQNVLLELTILTQRRKVLQVVCLVQKVIIAPLKDCLFRQIFVHLDFSARDLRPNQIQWF